MAASNESGSNGRGASDPLSGVARVRAVIDSAKMEQPDLAALAASDPRPGEARNGVEPGDGEVGADGLPPDCPVLPLGTEEGTYYFLNCSGELRAIEDKGFSQKTINSLFHGREGYLYWAWPQRNKSGEVSGWRAEKVTEALMRACAFKGGWSSADMVRGRGCWTDRSGNLVMHCGDRLLTADSELNLGELDGKIYPTRPALPRPWPDDLKDAPGPALRLLPHFQCWEWERPELDPLLLLGWVGVGYLGGALRWRPATFILGDKAAGKSSLQEDLKALFGPFLVQSADTTAAGIYQLLKHDCLPVAIDEFEGKADARQQKKVIELARLSSSGGRMMRGGESHKGAEFQGRSAYLFSSINSPPMDPQDLSRLALLRLARLKPGKEKPVIPEQDLEMLGRMVLKRLFEGWHRWADTFAYWRAMLADLSHDGRGQDTFGTLLAVADIILGNDAFELEIETSINRERCKPDVWREVLPAAKLIEYEDAAENWRLCLSHILSKRIEAWRGGKRHTVGAALHDASKDYSAKDDTCLSDKEVKVLLNEAGLTLLTQKRQKSEWALFVPNQHPHLHELFRDTKWQGDPSAGGWAGALRQAPDTMAKADRGYLDGRKMRGTAFLISEIIEMEEG